MREVAFLRGINVGGNAKIPMARLRGLMESIGFTDVKTYLQSGNVAFSAPGTSAAATEPKIEQALASEFGGNIRVLVRTRAELAKIVKHNPLGDVADNPSRQVVVFLSDKLDPKLLESIDPAQFEPEIFAVAGRELHMWLPDGQHKAKLPRALSEKKFGVVMTARNWNTVTRMLGLASGVE